MGSRQKREQLKKGLLWCDGQFVSAAEVEQAAGDKILRCRVCKEDVPTRLALEHVKECWGLTYETVALIPWYPPKSAYQYYQEHHQITEAQNDDAKAGQGG